MSGPRGRGRRPGGPDTRGQILASARRSFAEKGFDMSSVEEIAARAALALDNALLLADERAAAYDDTALPVTEEDWAAEYLSLDLAERLGGEVVNTDAMQVYRGMDVGTAKLTAAERRGVPHHLLDLWHVREPA